jgi:hypothetical protein
MAFVFYWKSHDNAPMNDVIQLLILILQLLTAARQWLARPRRNDEANDE